jgi:hypothetical protein
MVVGTRAAKVQSIVGAGDHLQLPGASEKFFSQSKVWNRERNTAQRRNQ